MVRMSDAHIILDLCWFWTSLSWATRTNDAYSPTPACSFIRIAILIIY